MRAKRKRDFLLSLNISLLIGMASSLLWISPAMAAEEKPVDKPAPQAICNATVRIMPLGDSITTGSSAEVPDNQPGKMISYRKDLWEILKAANYSLDFVGTLINGQDVVPEFDPHHEGHSGWAANEIRDNVYNFLAAKPADIILLHIGTNDLHSGQPAQDVVNEVGQILDNIDLYEDNTGRDVTVLLARILRPVGNGAAWIDFNNQLQQMAEARIAAGDDLQVVNIETGAGIIYKYYDDPVNPGDMYWNGKNGLHPYHTGFTKMAIAWKQAIDNLYQQCNDAPVIKSPGDQSSKELAQVNLKIQASDPDPGDELSYSAKQLPPGLSINSTSGLISGKISAGASKASPYPVIVRVTDNGNPARSDETSFLWVVQRRLEVFMPLILYRRN